MFPALTFPFLVKLEVQLMYYQNVINIKSKQLTERHEGVLTNTC